MRKTLGKYGPKRAQVRVFAEGELVRVQWRVNGLLRSKSWPDSGANRRLAKAFAEGIVEERGRPTEPEVLTLRSLWDLFVAAEFSHLRPRTKYLYTEYWRRWENMWGASFPAETATVEMLRDMRSAMAKVGKKGLSIATIRGTVKVVKMVHAFGEREGYLDRNKLHLFRFKVAKEDKVDSPAEFRGDEFTKLLAVLDPKNGLEWRPYVALAICGFQGIRQHSVLHLRWSDIDFENRRIRWRSEFDKVGKHDPGQRYWSQPMREGTIAALKVAAEKRVGDSPWVIPSRTYRTGRVIIGETYTAQSLWSALKSAEKRAGIDHVSRRGAHGLRRLLAGDVQALTGDPILAMQAIGDTDVRQAERYIKKRDDRITDVFTRLDNPEE